MISILGIAGAAVNAVGQVGVHVIADAAMKRLIPETTKLGLKICADVAAFFLSSAAGTVVANEVDEYVKKVNEAKEAVKKLVNGMQNNEEESETVEAEVVERPNGPEEVK